MSSIQITGMLLLIAIGAAAQADAGSTIMQIQGRGDRSPMEGQWVETTGIVTLCSRNHLRCWIQDMHGDGDPATSDGLALDLRRAPADAQALHPGDRVRVRGRVRERQFGAGLPMTELTRIRRLQRLERGRPLPAPVPLLRLPDVSLPQGIAFWEPLEGMRVKIDRAVVVGPTSRYGEFVVLTEANAAPGSGYAPSNHHLLLRPLDGQRVDYNPERIIVDDGARPTPDLQPGDRVRTLVGVVDYTFGNYKLQVERMRYQAGGQRSRQPPALAAGVRLATFNLENLFDTEHTPGKEDERSTPTPKAFHIKIAKLALAITGPLQAPEIIAVQEVETRAVLATLAERINRLGHHRYRAISFDSSDPRGIEVGVLWDSARIHLIQALRLDAADTGTAFGKHSVSPGREPLVARFEHRGQPLTVVVNHFKSKAGDDPLFGRHQPPRRPTERQRKAQARSVRAFVDRTLQQDPRALVAVVGDFNDFSFPEPGEGADHPLAILRSTGRRRLKDLSDELPAPQRYSFIYNGNSQLLDHVLVSRSLAARTVGIRAVHINADYPVSWQDDPSTPLRASDHDPIETSFRLH